jgi:hypothetical protein
VGTGLAGHAAAILRGITSTRLRHGINPQTYVTQLLSNLPDTPASEIDNWLPHMWKQSTDA